MMPLLAIATLWSLTLIFTGMNSLYLDTFAGLGVITLYLTYLIYRESNVLFATAYLYFSAIALPRICFPLIMWAGHALEDITGLECLVTNAHLFLTVIFISFVIMPKGHLFKLKLFFMLFAFIDTAAIITKWIMHMNIEPFFLMNNPSVDAAFLVCLIPFFLERKSKIIVSLIIFACILTKSSSGIMGVGLSLGVYFLHYYFNHPKFKKLSLKPVLVLALLAGVLSYIGFLMQGDHLVNSSGRTAIWKMAMSYWWNNMNIWFGAGAGTYQMWGYAIQSMDALAQSHGKGVTITSFPTMHSEPLQVLFETGIIGLGFVLTILAVSIWQSRKSPAINTALITYFAISLIQMNLRINLFAILGAFLVRSAFSASKKGDSYNSRHYYISRGQNYNSIHLIK